MVSGWVVFSSFYRMALSPLESAQLICSDSKHVKISQEGVESLSKILVDKMKANRHYIHFKGWKTHPLNPKVADDTAIDWIFLVDALNFSFWTPEGQEKYMVKYEEKQHTGYWSLCAAVNRALDEGIPITSADYCKNMSLEQAKQVFRSDSDTQMPLLEERVRVMNEVGGILIEKFDGKFADCVRRADGDAQKLLQIVVDNFPCFQDEGVFEGKRVSFYKRAQILVADVWACFEGQGDGKFEGIDSITMFADYRIPQALVYFNVMSYDEELSALLKAEHMFSSGELMEMEIRAASIWSVELLTQRMNELIKSDAELQGVHINAILLDHFLWDYRRAHDAEVRHIPYHKIRCVYY